MLYRISYFENCSISSCTADILLVLQCKYTCIIHYISVHMIYYIFMIACISLYLSSTAHILQLLYRNASDTTIVNNIKVPTTIIPLYLTTIYLLFVLLRMPPASFQALLMLLVPWSVYLIHKSSQLLHAHHENFKISRCCIGKRILMIQ